MYKIKREYLYNYCMNTRAKYCTPKMLAILQHNYLIPKNEVVNHLVVTLLAPKIKDFSKSCSLLTRITLVSGAQIIGHYNLWNRIFSKLNKSSSTPKNKGR